MLGVKLDATLRVLESSVTAAVLAMARYEHSVHLKTRTRFNPTLESFKGAA